MFRRVYVSIFKMLGPYQISHDHHQVFSRFLY